MICHKHSFSVEFRTQSRSFIKTQILSLQLNINSRGHSTANTAKYFKIENSVRDIMSQSLCGINHHQECQVGLQAEFCIHHMQEISSCSHVEKCT